MTAIQDCIARAIRRSATDASDWGDEPIADLAAEISAAIHASPDALIQAAIEAAVGRASRSLRALP